MKKKDNQVSHIQCVLKYIRYRFTLQETIHDLEMIVKVKGHMAHKYMIFSVNFTLQETIHDLANTKRSKVMYHKNGLFVL